MSQLLLIAVIAGQPVALRTEDVQSVIELELITPIPRAPVHVAGLTALRSQVLTVIDCQRSLGLAREAGAILAGQAAVIERDGHHYALAVDGVSDVVPARSEPCPVPLELDAGWSAAARGMVETDRGPLLLIDVDVLIFGAERAQAA